MHVFEHLGFGTFWKLNVFDDLGRCMYLMMEDSARFR